MARIFVEGNTFCLPDSEEYLIALELGKQLASNNFTIVSNVRKGVTEAVFKGAYMTNENIIRLAVDCAEINLPRNTVFSKEIIADNFFDMKMRICVNSDGFVFLTGSFSVLSNIAIILQLKQLELMGNKPIICVGDQWPEVLNTLSFYNENSLKGFTENVILVKSVDEAVNNLVNFFNKM